MASVENPDPYSRIFTTRLDLTMEYSEYKSLKSGGYTPLATGNDLIKEEKSIKFIYWSFSDSGVQKFGIRGSIMY
jgi:hypothetical protein